MKSIRFLFLFLAVIVVCSACELDQDDPAYDTAYVQTIGDSIFDWTGDIHDRLESLANCSYKDRSTSGGELPSIRQQYEDAVYEDDVRTIIMTGGANDLLMNNEYYNECQKSPLTDKCKSFIDGLGDSTEALLYDMYVDGEVDDVIFLGYYHIKDGSAAFYNPGRYALNPALDYSNDVAKSICDNASINCYFIENLTETDGHPEYIISDGLHPETILSNILADKIWDTANNNGVYMGCEGSGGSCGAADNGGRSSVYGLKSFLILTPLFFVTLLLGIRLRNNKE